MKKLLLLLLTISPLLYAKAIRIKDLVTIKGVRENPLIGYGLVIGLNGTGDGGTEVTSQSLIKMFKTLGLNPQKEVASSNVASVIVTAKLPPFARIGQKIDVTVSSIGDASSLAGGTLLVTPLKGGDGKIYSIANGPLSIGGLQKGSKFATTGRIPGGGIVERDLDLKFTEKNALRLALKDPDFTTIARIAKTINQELGGKYALPKDSGTIDLIVPEFYKRKIVDLIAIVENFRVIPDQIARIIINERTGTLVAGGEIAVKQVALSHGDIVLKVEGEDQEKELWVHEVKKSTTISELINALNTIGTTPEDLISIFQALKKNGAITADIELI
ncbi:MAG: flagellar basal body P-ring protein FlgI [Halobacteriovoraceae bacterium]|nr:flagellar basal body P-ring protein FlgI [Halobacteriovoraceae bacterium]